MKTTEDKLRKLNEKANIIYNDSFLTWNEKYDQIFSEKISRKVFDLIRLDYYDPDTSYEEDVRAFMSAFNERMKS
jgi:hypothetical protein